MVVSLGQLRESIGSISREIEGYLCWVAGSHAHWRAPAIQRPLGDEGMCGWMASKGIPHQGHTLEYPSWHSSPISS